MCTRLITLLCIVFALDVAHANPTSVTVHERDLDRLRSKVVRRLDEPTGLQITENIPKLRLRKGDVVRTVNGVPGITFLPLFESFMYLEVVRGSKLVTLRYVLQAEPTEYLYERDELVAWLDRMRQDEGVRNEAFEQVTERGAPSGVLVHWPNDLRLPPHAVVHAVGGERVRTVNDLLTVMQGQLEQPKLVFALERVHQKLTHTLVLESMPEPAASSALAKAIGRIKRRNATTFEIPRDVRDALFANPDVFANHARVVPALANGKPVGWKIYAIRPDSLYAALGFVNGDTIRAVNGQPLDSAEANRNAYSSLKTAKNLTVMVMRRGHLVDLAYTVK